MGGVQDGTFGKLRLKLHEKGMADMGAEHHWLMKRVIRMHF